MGVHAGGQGTDLCPKLDGQSLEPVAQGIDAGFESPPERIDPPVEAADCCEEEGEQNGEDSAQDSDQAPEFRFHECKASTG